MNKEEFLKEFEALKKKFPRPGNNEDFNTNCQYVDDTYESTDSYYAFNSVRLESCNYIYDGGNEKGDVDCFFNFQTENCLECIDCFESNGSNFSDVVRSYNMDFCRVCSDCHDCFGCSHLQNKSYCIFNVQHTEEEYKAKLPELKKMTREEAFKKLDEVDAKFPRLHSYYNESENSEYCDYSYFNNNCYYCFDCAHNEDCYYMLTSYRNSDVFDSLYSVDSEQSVQIIGSYKCYSCYDAQDCRRCYDSYYLYRCSDCNDCFGCVELTHKKYCILNVQYTKEEYEKKLTELKESLELKYSQS